MPRRPWTAGLTLLTAVLASAAAAQAPPRPSHETAPPPRPLVGEVAPELREQLKLDPFYRKHADLEGLPILSSAKVSDAALVEARHLIRQVLARRPDVLKAMVTNRVRVVVMAPTEMTTDVPEQRHLKNDPKTNWDKRARGLGGRITSCGEENLLNLKGDRYRNENILIHEFAHAVHRYGIGSLDRTFDARLKQTYDRAVGKGLWKGTYAATNRGEYWAEGVQSYFDCNNPPNRSHNDVNTREELAEYDPDLFELIDESYGKNPWRYVRYDKRNPAASAVVTAPPLTAELIKGLPLRGIGPCLTPGRIGDIAIDTRNRSVWYVAVASGGLWKTTNRGTTWKPVFDDHGSYSIGCVALDPKNPDVVWLGTGENQAQRSVGFGDGVYKSTDGGATWAHTGLKNSEHVAKILIDPRDSDVVFVASQGPLWCPGGDRGLFKTTDGGKSWTAVLTVSENTGVTDACFDPRDPDVLYAASYQRRRNVGTLVGGGPESAIYKSTDAGKTWKKLTTGLPSADTGRIALAVSPQKSDVVYAHVTAAGKQGGFFRSADRGETWERRSSYAVVDPQYYGEIYPDPHAFDRVYALDVAVHVTDDGGKSFRPAGWAVHPDNHALAFDPGDPLHLLVGNDGGLYETHDGGATWRNFTNLPTAQFYRVAVDNAAPFYTVYGGAQDNGSMGGPARTRNQVGVRTSDWGRVGGADGMQPRVDPTDPDTVYTMSQNGAIVRLDRATGRSTPIRPRAEGKDAVRWNWDAPLILSPHNPRRLYLAGSRLFRSDDRGDTWKSVSPDLTRRLAPLRVEVMGKLWGSDAVGRNLFTTALSVASALSESPVKEGLLYVGTDDGLLQVSDDGGGTWRKADRFPGVPDGTYVSDLFASAHDPGTVYVAFNNWQRGDFKPYLLKSTDGGKTWASVVGNLPDRHCVWCVFEDTVNKALLFCGTEFGLFVTIDGGASWARVSGAPTVAFRDLEVQRREGDLVCGTFGRGIFVLDDYAPLRHLTPEVRSKEGVLLPVRRTWAVAELPFARASGEFAAPNPPAGALITFHLREKPAGDAKVAVRVADATGKLVREIPAPSAAGVQRVSWDLRPAGRAGPPGGRRGSGGGAPPVPPGKYTATLVKLTGGESVVLGEPQMFEVVSPDRPSGKAEP